MNILKCVGCELRDTLYCDYCKNDDRCLEDEQITKKLYSWLIVLASAFLVFALAVLYYIVR